MASAPPSAPWPPFRRSFTSWRRGQMQSPVQHKTASHKAGRRSNFEIRTLGGLDIFAQRFLLALILVDAPFHDVADGNQADHALALDDRQMTEFAVRHHLHDGGDRIGLLAAYHLARHDRADGLVKHRSAPFAEHPHDVAFRQDAFDSSRIHHKYGADLALGEEFDRGGELCFRWNAQNIVTFGVENCTYRHCRLPEAGRALENERGLFSFFQSSNNSAAPVWLRARIRLRSTDPNRAATSNDE